MHDMLSYVDAAFDPGRATQDSGANFDTPGATVRLNGDGQSKPIPLDMQHYLRGCFLPTDTAIAQSLRRPGPGWIRRQRPPGSTVSGGKEAISRHCIIVLAKQSCEFMCYLGSSGG